jgi:hypothetical protein
MGQFKTLWAVPAITALLLSCTPVDRQEREYYYQNREGQTVSAKTGLPIAEPRGLNASVMDDELSELLGEAKTIEDRIRNLIMRLAQLQSNIKNLQGHNEVKEADLTLKIEAENDENMPQVLIPTKTKPVQVKSVKAPLKPQAGSSTEKAKTNNAAGVYNVRTGIHANKTRFVLDVNGSTSNIMNFDAEAGIVTITMPDTSWNAPRSKTYDEGKILGYEAKASNGGTIIAMAVQNTSSVEILRLQHPDRLVVDALK